MQNRTWIDGKYPDGEETQITIEGYPEKGKLMIHGQALPRPVVLDIDAIEMTIRQAKEVDAYNLALADKLVREANHD